MAFRPWKLLGFILQLRYQRVREQTSIKPNSCYSGIRMARYIRLLEHGPNHDQWMTPSDEYLAERDGTLEKRPYRYRTDEHGFIRTGRTLPQEEKPLIFLGDSVIENYWVDEDKRTCAVLEGLLRDAGLAVRVLNGGVSGASTLHLLSVLINKCVPLQPRMVLLMSGAIDTSAMKFGGYWCSHEHLTPITEPPNLPERDFTDRAKLMHIFHETCRTFEIDFFAVTCPTRHAPLFDDCSGGTPGVRRNSLSREALRLSNQITREYGGPFIDLEVPLSGRPELFYDDLHAGEMGCRLMAEHLFEAIKRNLLYR
jgi:GDSL-like Lipase/Acylhydrolase family